MTYDLVKFSIIFREGWGHIGIILSILACLLLFFLFSSLENHVNGTLLVFFLSLPITLQLDLRPSQQEGNYSWYCKPSQPTRASKIMISFIKFIVMHTTHFLWSIIRKTVNSIYKTIQLNTHFFIELIFKSMREK